MRWGVIALLIPATTALAQEAPVRMLGEKWTTASGLNRRAALRIMLRYPDRPPPELIRRVALNLHDFPVEKGPYPQAALAGEQGGTVRVELTIADTGVPTACTVARPSGIASLDAHACPHVLRHIRFYPALTRDGRRMGATIAASLSYSVIPTVPSARAIGMLPVPLPIGKQALPLTSPELAMTAALSGRTLPPQIGSVGATLRVETDGRVSTCILYNPTQIDEIDKALCERLIPIRFTAATDTDGQSVASNYPVAVLRP